VARIGGTVWHAGLTLSRLGFPVRVVTRLAEAEREIAAALVEAGIEARITPSRTTTVFHNTYGGGWDDRSQTVAAVAEPITADCLSPALAHGGLCYLGPLHPDDLSAEAVATVRRLKGPRVALDVQGYTRRIVAGRVVPEVAPELFPTLAFADVVKANAAEACLIAETRDPAEAIHRLAAGREGTEILVTDGAAGVHLSFSGEVRYEPAVELGDVDPTGAGDIFLAAYLAGRLLGEAPWTALDLAVRHTAFCLAQPVHDGLLTP
jgi:sugar/nucleoside kinase (ribokinase family)